MSKQVMHPSNCKTGKKVSYILGEDDFSFDWDDNGDKFDPGKYGIRLINHPMNYTDSQLDKELL